MKKSSSTTEDRYWVGMDDHAATIVVAVLRNEEDAPMARFTVGNDEKGQRCERLGASNLWYRGVLKSCRVSGTGSSSTLSLVSNSLRSTNGPLAILGAVIPVPLTRHEIRGTSYQGLLAQERSHPYSSGRR